MDIMANTLFPAAKDIKVPTHVSQTTITEVVLPEIIDDNLGEIVYKYINDFEGFLTRYKNSVWSGHHRLFSSGRLKSYLKLLEFQERILIQYRVVSQEPISYIMLKGVFDESLSLAALLENMSKRTNVFLSNISGIASYANMQFILKELLCYLQDIYYDFA